MAVEVKNARHTPQFRAGIWDGYQRFFAPATASFLTGLLSWVEALLVEKEVEVREIADLLPPCTPRVPEPKAVVTLRDYQEKTVEEAIRLRRGIVEAAVNCLAGSTEIQVFRGGNVRKYQLETLVSRFNKEPIKFARGYGRITFWGDNETFVRTRTPDGYIRLAKLVGAYRSGFKKLFRLVLENGKSIDASGDHRFLVEQGWRRLSSLRAGDKIYAEAPREKRVVGGLKIQRVWVRRVKPFHPYRTGHRYRLAVEAQLNRLPYWEFIKRVRARKIRGLKFLDPKKFEVHHKDHNIRNDNPRNLEVFRKDGSHQRMHGISHTWRNVTRKTELVSIRSIIPIGTFPTFDLEVGEHHNFIANGIVTHNSGKTSMGIEIIRRLRVPTVYVVPDKSLYVQALKAFRTELPAIQLGELRASHFRPGLVTVAMIQSLTRGLATVGGSEEIRKWIKTIECVISDECHHLTGKKFSLVFKRAVRAPYRYGLSATPFGMSTVKDRTLIGLIGPPFGAITVRDLEARGLSVPMEVRFISYAQVVEGLRAYGGRDYREIWRFGVEENTDRAAAMYRAVLPHILAGERVLVFVDQIGHGNALAGLSPPGTAAERLYGTEPASERERIERAFRDGAAPLLVTTLLKEGVNIPEIDVVVNASGRKSEWLVRQQGGRGVRLRQGKERVVLYDFIDAGHKILLAHSHARHAAYKKEGYPITLVAPLEPEFTPIVT